MLRPRNGRPGGHDRLRQDGGCRLADRPARRQYADPRASPPIAGAMGRAAFDVPRSAAQGDWPHRRRPQESPPVRWTWPSFKAWCARASSRIAWRNTATSSSTSATISRPRASSRSSAGPRPGSSWGSPPRSRARTATIRSSSCSAGRCGIVVDAKAQAAARPFRHVVLVRPTSFRPLRQADPDLRMQFQTLYGELIADDERNRLICDEVVAGGSGGPFAPGIDRAQRTPR